MEKKKRVFKRFTLNQRIQHVIMIVTFFILAITGLPLKWEDSEISQAVVNLMGGWEMRAHIHHIAGFVLGALGIYHVIMYLVIDRKPKKILPRIQDFKDFWQYVKSIFGKAERPKYDRFSWKEKFDYWGAFWGMTLMGVTGLIMMYPDEVIQLFGSTGWVEVAWIAHSEEALLAVSAIAIWHLWNVHFNPKHFPMSKVWISGKMTEKEMMEEHPLEYNKLMGIKIEVKEPGRKWRNNKYAKEKKEMTKSSEVESTN